MIGCIRHISLFANTCNRLYRRSAIQDLRFSERMTYGEDNFFNFRAYSRASQSVLDRTPLYHYIQRADSATATRDRLSEDRLYMIRTISSELEGDPDWAGIRLHVNAREVMDVVQLLINMAHSPQRRKHRRERLRYSTELRGLAAKAVPNPVLSPKFKLATVLAVIHPTLLYTYLRLYNIMSQRALG